jgi:hypothetical protein
MRSVCGKGGPDPPIPLHDRRTSDLGLNKTPQRKESELERRKRKKRKKEKKESVLDPGSELELELQHGEDNSVGKKQKKGTT